MRYNTFGTIGINSEIQCFKITFGFISSVPATAVSTLLNADEIVVMGHEGCRERLAEYLEL